MAYFWQITGDFRDPWPECHATGVEGPDYIQPDVLRWMKREGRPFRLRDPDGRLMFKGRIVSDERPFPLLAPLDEFGRDYDCVVIEYLNDVGLWESV